MARLLSIILLTLGIVGAFMFYTAKNAPTDAPIKGKEVLSEETAIVQEDTAIDVPMRVIIPKLGVDAQIEHVGLDKDKRMDVPKEDMNAAWYNKGPKPGELGSAVLAGHLDTKTGGPAVFYRLSELQTGDEIQVQDRSGLIQTFEVAEVRSYKDETFPVSLVFSQNDTKRLNLITCAGTFDSGAQNYSDRTVVFATLRESL